MHERIILVVDVSGSTRLFHELGNRAAFELVQSVVQRADQLTAEVGRVVKHLGDGFFALLDDLPTTLQTCAKMFETCSSGDPRLKLRMGMHFGEVLETDSDAFGDAINVAFRISDFSRPGQLIAVAELVERLNDEERAAVKLLGAVALQGKPGAHKFYDISTILPYTK